MNMKTFSFPFAVAVTDSETYLIDCTDKDDAEKVTESLRDFCDNELAIAKVVPTDDEYYKTYNAISLTRYPSSGYKTKEELFAAYDEIIGDKEITAYSMDNVESAVIGITEDLTRFVYDYDLIIQALMDEETDEISAIEWYEFNIVRSLSYYQPSPIVLHCVNVE